MMSEARSAYQDGMGSVRTTQAKDPCSEQTWHQEEIHVIERMKETDRKKDRKKDNKERKKTRKKESRKERKVSHLFGYITQAPQDLTFMFMLMLKLKLKFTFIRNKYAWIMISEKVPSKNEVRKP